MIDRMAKLRATTISVSLDGYMAGPDQSLDNPLGVGALDLHQWLFGTKSWQASHGDGVGATGVDDDFAARANENIGATIMGRNMFGPVRGPWPDDSWTGWWGENPPFHHDVFVLSHHPRESFSLDGGTTFHFVTDGPEAALSQAVAAADGKDVRVGGGASAIQQYLRLGLLDELHMAIVPVLLGAGERIFDHLDGGPTGYRCAEMVSSPAVTHVRLVRD